MGTGGLTSSTESGAVQLTKLAIAAAASSHCNLENLFPDTPSPLAAFTDDNKHRMMADEPLSGPAYFPTLASIA